MIANRYQLLEPIATSDRSSVFCAADTALNRDVAIKRHVPSLAAFHEREAAALARLSHPAIVSLYDTGADSEGGYLVLELLHGETLEARVRRGPLSVPELLALAHQGLQALAVIHEAGLIHRDVTPENLMLLPLHAGPFHLKIIDFELAQPISQACPDAATGSVHFMAPEQFENVSLDARTDLYALGAVLHFAATQHYPFEGETNAQVITAHLRHLGQPLEQLRPDLPLPLIAWITQLLSRDPKQRPASAAQALALLEAL
ncbi:MAG: serine/threonine-protein kinase [Prosthecobacter sp.]|nr:serine/threonine-protein kinase [Prosthecobacter sp.]